LRAGWPIALMGGLAILLLAIVVGFRLGFQFLP